MTDLELLKSTFDKLGVKYSIAEDIGKIHVPGTGTRDYKKNEQGQWVWVGWTNGDEWRDYQLRLDTDGGFGHAEPVYFFTSDGNFVCHAGYES